MLCDARISFQSAVLAISSITATSIPRGLRGVQAINSALCLSRFGRYLTNAFTSIARISLADIVLLFEMASPLRLLMANPSGPICDPDKLN